MNKYHIFYTREGKLPTGVNIEAMNESDAIKLFCTQYDYSEIIYMAQMELIHAIKQND